MIGTTVVNRLGIPWSNVGVTLSFIGKTGKGRSIYLVCHTSAIAIICSFFAEPAVAQPRIAAHTPELGATADGTAAPGAQSPAAPPKSAQGEGQGADAAQQADNEITVTGSRVITSNLNSPTPITSSISDRKRVR